MNSEELHAYLHGPDFTALTQWIESQISDLERKETFDLTEDIGQIIVRYDGNRDFWLLEQHVGTGWLEITIRPKASNSTFIKWDNLQLGECLVDDLGGITLVDDKGKYGDPSAPYSIRISAEKVELVEFPDKIGDPFDENSTKFIKWRR